MSQTVNAIYDGTVLLPDEALELEPNTRVRIVVEPLTPPERTGPERTGSFLRLASGLNLSGPPDWSSTFDKK